MSGIERQKRMTRIVAEWDASGLDADAMARRSGVSKSTLWRWKGRLERACVRSAAPGRLAAFLPVKLVGSTETTTATPVERPAGCLIASPFELVLPDGRLVVIPADFSPTSLARLVAVLREC